MDTLAQTPDIRAKNVPEELTKFLSQHPSQWFTNEQLADRLSHTSSGIRNAVTKLKGTGLVQTRMAGTLAFRAWHTAEPNDSLPPSQPGIQKKVSCRCCNHCGTGESRYWRSDLQNPNKWLCNSCGMSQRRGKDRVVVNARNIHEGGRFPEEAAMHTAISNLVQLNAAQKSRTPGANTRKKVRNSNASTPLLGAINEGGRSGSDETEEWSRQPESPEHRGDYTFSFASRRRTDSGYIHESVISKEGNTLARTLNLAECKHCQELMPVLKLESCHHSFCGECIPTLIRGHCADTCIECSECKTRQKIPCSPASSMEEKELMSVSLIPIALFGNFMDHLQAMSAL